MRKLHLVGLTTDRDGLIFTARKGSKSGGFIVPLDDKVLAAVAEASAGGNGRPSAGEAAAASGDVVPKRLRSESALTPREMQARLRAGRTIEEVAAEAGVDTEWVARFAVPILAEQAQVVELARNLVYAKPRLGESSQQLGPSVLQNLSDRGVFLPDDVANAGWSAFQLHDSVWMVRFRYRARGRDQEAQWEIDVPTGRLRARNRHASDLGYVDPDRWQATVDPDETLLDEEPAPVAPRRRAARAAPEPEPPLKAPAAKKRRAPRPAPASAKAVKAVKARKPAKSAAPTTATKAAPRTAKVTKVSPPARTGKAASAGAKTSPRTASAKSPAKRRSTKAVAGPDAGPTAGSGSVRMAVAQVSTARVAASMAAADRAPWAAAVRRSGRSDGDPVAAGRRSPSRSAASEPVRQPRRGDTAPVRPFQPRPLPPPGQEPVAPRVRKVTVPRKPIDPDGAPSVTLPAPRRPSPQQDAMPVERAKRRRLRSR